MARSCYVLTVGGKEYKLRLTLKGQKNLMNKAKKPDMEAVDNIMAAMGDRTVGADTLAVALRAATRDPNASMMGIIMEAIDDPVAMGDLLTEALTWEGNPNKLRSGEDLYDLMVEDGYSGTEDFLDVVLGIAHKAGLLSEADCARVARSTKRMLRKGMEGLDIPDEDEEGEESPENPQEEFETL